jgi:hypothetical protein
MWRMSGIFRSVSLLHKPARHLMDIRVTPGARRLLPGCPPQGLNCRRPTEPVCRWRPTSMMATSGWRPCASRLAPGHRRERGV